MNGIATSAGATGNRAITMVVKKVLVLVLAGLILGWGYNWAAARFYHEDQTAGFWLGALHGGLMPAALPSLLVGRDVPIFAPNNSGRGYKLGYIAGINLCGLVFFGLAFRRPGTARTMKDRG